MTRACGHRARTEQGARGPQPEEAETEVSWEQGRVGLGAWAEPWGVGQGQGPLPRSENDQIHSAPVSTKTSVLVTAGHCPGLRPDTSSSHRQLEGPSAPVGSRLKPGPRGARPAGVPGTACGRSRGVVVAWCRQVLAGCRPGCDLQPWTQSPQLEFSDCHSASAGRAMCLLPWRVHPCSCHLAIPCL